MFINSVVQRNSAVFHLELRSSDVYVQRHSQRPRRRCGLVCERSERQRRQYCRPHKIFSSALCVLCGCCGHTLIIITLGTRDGISIYTLGPTLPDCDVAARATINMTDVRAQKLNQSPKYQLYRILILDYFSKHITT